MGEWIRQLTSEHETVLDHLDDSMTALVEIRDKKRGIPADPGAVVNPLLQWMQREFLPHLQQEQDLCRPVFLPISKGESLYQEMVSQHEKLRALMKQAREEMVLLLNQDSIREAWWDTLDLSSLWAFRRAFSEHIDYEHREIFPKALALNAAESA